MTIDSWMQHPTKRFLENDMRGPNGLDLVSNDEVAGWVRQHPKRLAGLARS